MSFFGSIGHAFKVLGKLIGKGFKAAAENGLTDPIVLLALGKVKALANEQLDNSNKREAAVAFLVDRKVPESIARISVELAVQLFKKEIGKIPGV